MQRYCSSDSFCKTVSPIFKASCSSLWSHPERASLKIASHKRATCYPDNWTGRQAQNWTRWQSQHEPDVNETEQYEKLTTGQYSHPQNDTYAIQTGEDVNHTCNHLSTAHVKAHNGQGRSGTLKRMSIAQCATFCPNDCIMWQFHNCTICHLNNDPLCHLYTWTWCLPHTWTRRQGHKWTRCK